jgi:uncharacterized protein
MNDSLSPPVLDQLTQVSQHNYQAIVAEILSRYTLPLDGPHGILHWARVWRNGEVLAAETGADLEVVRLFALLHDACRLNENNDPGHGRRGARLAESWRGALIHLSDARFAILAKACNEHTDGLVSKHPTIAACWDADRLDLGRVGVPMEQVTLCTEAAKRIHPTAWTSAALWHEPGGVLQRWGVSSPCG